MADLYLYEFLFRGRAPGATEPPDYHVILAQDTVDPFTGQPTTNTSLAMTPEQAKARGFDIPAVVAAIDTGTMAENTALKDQVATLQSQVADLQMQLDAAKADVEAQPMASPA